MSSVTRFGEFSPLWLIVKVLGYLAGQNLESTFANFNAFGENFVVKNGQTLNKYSRHLATLSVGSMLENYFRSMYVVE